MLLADFPDKNVFGFLNGGASVQGAASRERSGAGERRLRVGRGRRLDREEDCSDDLFEGDVVRDGDRPKATSAAGRTSCSTRGTSCASRCSWSASSAVLMAGLGMWVMKEANEATTVAMARVRGEACPKIPVLSRRRRRRRQRRCRSSSTTTGVRRAGAAPARAGRSRAALGGRSEGRRASTTRRRSSIAVANAWCLDAPVQAASAASRSRSRSPRAATRTSKSKLDGSRRGRGAAQGARSRS